MLSLDEIVGQTEATDRLARLLEQDRLPHALLFVGPTSTGKRATAEVLARLLMCTNPNRSARQACGVCPGCQKMAASSHGDFHVVTTEKATIFVGQIREATQRLALRPIEGGVKVMIIEDAERMNASAQNALLKTLEEPPGATHIILTTSRLRAILPTVVSRSQRVHFAPLPTDRVAHVVAERRGLPPEQAQVLAALAQGSLGAALEMDYESILERRDRVAEIDRDLWGRSGRTAVAATEAAADLTAEKGGLVGLLDLWLVWLHDQMLLAAGADVGGVANADRLADLRDLADERGLTAVLERAEDVMEARRQAEAPFHWNPLLIAEQLCLALSGNGRLERVEIHY